MRRCLPILFLLPLVAKSQGPSEAEIAKANNPLADGKALNFQNYYVHSIYEDASLKANSFLLRYSTSFANGRILTRFTLPVVTNPTGYDNNGTPKYASGLGDFNFFATYIFSKPGSKTILGAGPQIVFPTGTNEFTGSGKWQVGAAFVIFNTSSPNLQKGALITYQTSVGGQSDRAEVSLLALQPFLIFSVARGAYLRSTALMNFNLETGAYTVPLGIGAGQVIKSKAWVFNIFLEPQITFLHYGSLQPALQVFGGINCQF